MSDPKKETAEFSWVSFWQKNQISLSLGLVGLILISLGVFFALDFHSEPDLEILPADSEAEKTSLWVDLEGAVMNPGVYEMPPDSRLNNLLVKAGGLGAEADRDWVEKNLNLAQKLTDGVKIYIPKVGEAVEAANPAVAGESAGLSKINLNTASAARLDTLWGIGAARAADIIANRPYGVVEDLKGVVPENVFEKIKDQVSVF